jgi:hypothetical protein
MRKSDLDLIARIPPKMAKRKWDSSSGFYPSLRNLVQVDSGGWREDLRPVTLGAWQRLPVGALNCALLLHETPKKGRLSVSGLLGVRRKETYD